MIIPLYKPLGLSTHSFVKAYGDFIGEKITHTGSLDPMAEGLIVALTGEDRFRKEELGDVRKTYEFEVLAGTATDSLDVLGLVVNIDLSESVGVKDKISAAAPSFIGEYEQEVPAFSAKRINGESYFDKAKRGEEWRRELCRVRAVDLRITGDYSLSREDLLEKVEQKISRVEGDFRQAQVLDSWQRALRAVDSGAVFPIVRMIATVSKRFYIRALVRDMAVRTGVPLTTFSIRRVAHGDITVRDAIDFAGDNSRRGL